MIAIEFFEEFFEQLRGEICDKYCKYPHLAQEMFGEDERELEEELDKFCFDKCPFSNTERIIENAIKALKEREERRNTGC